jgi:hypothetical protein
MLNNKKRVNFQPHPFHFIFDLGKSCYTKINKLKSVKLLTRPFSTTVIKRADPLGTTALAFSTSYAYSLLANPFGGAFILLMGMAAALFFLTGYLPEFFAQDPSYAMILVRLDNLLLLFERFLLYEQNGINLLVASINNFSPEVLGNLYLSLQELVTVRESLFFRLESLINSPEIEFLEGPLVDRINNVFEDLRLGGNNLMALIREIEDKLGISESERIPSF